MNVEIMLAARESRRLHRSAWSPYRPPGEYPYCNFCGYPHAVGECQRVKR